MAKYITTTKIVGLTGKGSVIEHGTLLELDEQKPEHARLIKGKSVELYIEPEKPKEVKLQK